MLRYGFLGGGSELEQVVLQLEEFVITREFSYDLQHQGIIMDSVFAKQEIRINPLLVKNCCILGLFQIPAMHLPNQIVVLSNLGVVLEWNWYKYPAILQDNRRKFPIFRYV